MSLTDAQRSLIHDLALDARDLLTREAHDLLEGVYGLKPDGTFESADKLPPVQSDAIAYQHEEWHEGS